MSLSSDGVVFVWRVYAAASGLKYEALATVSGDSLSIPFSLWFHHPLPRRSSLILIA